MRFPRHLAFLCTILTTFALIATGCGDDSGTDVIAPPSTGVSTTAPPTTDTAASATVDVGVYFVATVTEPAAGGVVDALAASTRTVEVAGDATPASAAEAALAALLSGPTDFEREIGFSSTVPQETEFLGLLVDGTVATVDLSAGFEVAAGALTDTLRIAQVVFTLTAVDGIDAVRFEIDGTLRDVIGTHGVTVDTEAGAVRDDFPEARPPILVEQPAPGTAVAGSSTVSGESNTFEANVRWALTDPDGEILDEGFTTATGGNGTWGSFEFTVTVDDVDRAGLGALILWEDSAEDGRQVNIVEVPIEFSSPG